jgi:hypothetical protein
LTPDFFALTPCSSFKEVKLMAEPNGVEKTIAAAGTLQELANLWAVSRVAIYDWKKRGYFPIERARDANARFGIPLRELVSPQIREAMDASAAQA